MYRFATCLPSRNPCPSLSGVCFVLASLAGIARRLTGQTTPISIGRPARGAGFLKSRPTRDPMTSAARGVVGKGLFMGQAVLPTILLVDGDAVRATATAMDLRRSLAGYTIETTGHGGNLLGRISQLPDGACACIVLPGPTESETDASLMTKIRRHGSDVPVVCASGGHRGSTAKLADRIRRAIALARRRDGRGGTRPPTESPRWHATGLPLSTLTAPPLGEPSSSGGAPHDGAIKLHTAVEMVQAICRKDQATSSHCMWVGWLAAEVGRRLGMSPEQTEELRTAGVLHDVGKLDIPKSILLKPGPLTEQERRVVDRHAKVGAEIVARRRGGQRLQQAIRCHHDWYDGSRNVSGLDPRRLSPYARILSVADAYQSMIEERPYRLSRTPAQAIRELRRCSGTQFDPTVVRALAEIMDRPDDQPVELLDADPACPTNTTN